MAFLKSIVILALLGVALATVARPSDKISLKLKNTLKTKATANVFIKLRHSTSEILNSISSARYSGRNERLDALHNTLKQHAAISQKTVSRYLTENEVKFESFWINNKIFIENANLALIERLATLYDVEEIYQEHVVKLEQPKIGEVVTSETKAVQWGVERMGADRVWGLDGGTNGSGVVVGGIDTGVRYTHEALIGNWRNPYGWRDPSQNTELPVDTNGHGTHTIGTIAGADGIGVAPGSQWIACRGCAVAQCTERDLIVCGEFMACPTDPQGNNSDCSKAPHLVSNSWSDEEVGLTWYDEVTAAWVAVGIVPLFSIGNSGSACNTANYPSDAANVIGVGATTDNVPDQITYFSSKGPAAITGLVKPDISAPGSNIYSAFHTSDRAYTVMSGTSMACPHAAGAVALILGVAPNATIPAVRDILFNYATRTVASTGLNCGGIAETQWPNNAFGHGRIDVYSSVINVLGKGQK